MSSTATTKKISFCRTCHNACGVVVEVDDRGRAISMTGDRENPLYEGYTCVKGRATPQMVDDPHRLKHSIKRLPDGSFERIDVEEAMDEIAIVLRRLIDEHGPRSVANYAGTAAINVNFPITRPVVFGFAEAIGSPMRFETMSIDQPGKMLAKGFHGVWMAPATGRVDPEIVLLVGQNPIASHAGFPMGNPGGWLTKQLARGMKLVVIDPRRTDVGRRATLYLQPKPGNDPAILASLIHVILEERLYDSEFVAENASGLEELRTAVARYTPGEVGRVADVDPDDLVRAARMYAEAHRAYAACGTGPSMNGYSTLVEYLRMNLMALCGHWQREGDLIQNAGVAGPPRHAKAQAMPPFPAYGFGEQLRVRGLSESLSGVPTAAATDEILLPGEGQVRALLSCAGNPVAAWPDQLRTLRAMEALELLVSLDVQMTQTARFAHYVIATRMSLEVPGVTFLGDLFDLLGPGLGLAKSYGQYTPRVVEPPEGSEVIEEWEFYYGIAKRLGVTLRMTPYVPTDDPYTFDMERKPTTEELLEAHMAGARIPLDELKRHPHGAFFPSDLHVEPKDDGWEGRLDLANGEMLADLESFEASLAAPGDDDPVYPFRLISRRMKDTHNSDVSRHSSPAGAPAQPCVHQSRRPRAAWRPVGRRHRDPLAARQDPRRRRGGPEHARGRRVDDALLRRPTRRGRQRAGDRQSGSAAVQRRGQLRALLRSAADEQHPHRHHACIVEAGNLEDAPMSTDMPLMELMKAQVSAEAERYADTFTTGPSAAVSALLAETQEVTPVPIMAGGIKEARLLEALVVVMGARSVLEIGTFTGATALALAEVLPSHGRVTTIEVDEAVASVARRHFDASPHGVKIDLRLGDARAILESLDGPFDLVFIDALKAQYIEYYEAVLGKLSPRGLIVADNVVWYGLPFNPQATDRETEGVRAFVEHVRSDERTRHVLLTVGDGLLLIWRS